MLTISKYTAIKEKNEFCLELSIAFEISNVFSILHGMPVRNWCTYRSDAFGVAINNY